MKKLRNPLILLLAAALLLSLSACTLGGNDTFTVVSRLETRQLCLAYRTGDRAGELIIAALAQLQADGDISDISRDWFRADLITLKGEKNALEGLETGQRSLIVGYDKGHLPYSGQDAEGLPIGFEIDLAREVGAALGWRVEFLPIDTASAEIELKSGNVDCVFGVHANFANAKDMSLSPPYMNTTVIIAAMNGSGITSENALAGKTLAIGEYGQFFDCLTGKPELMDKPEYIIRLPGSSDDCIRAMMDGACDAVVTDTAAIEYFR